MSRRSGCSCAAAAAGALLLAATPSCKGAGDRRAVACDDRSRVVALHDTHYPDESCESATSIAEDRLTMGYYRTACQQLAPSAGLPSRVEAALVLACEPASRVEGYDRGVVVQIEICCL